MAMYSTPRQQIGYVKCLTIPALIGVMAPLLRRCLLQTHPCVVTPAAEAIFAERKPLEHHQLH